MQRVLLIDANRRTRRNLRRALGRSHYVTATHSILRGLQLLRKRVFDCAVVRSAQHNAYATALLKWLRQRGACMPVVVVLGAHSGANVDRMIQIGATTVLPWPGQSDRLLAAVSQAVSQTRPAVRCDAYRDAMHSPANSLRLTSQRPPRRRQSTERFRDEHGRSWLRSRLGCG